MQKILVTGGLGYVGSHLLDLLVKDGAKLCVLDSCLYSNLGEYAVRFPEVEFIKGDICNIKNLVQAMEGVDTVIALAAIVGDPACELNPAETIATNFESTKVLVEIASLMRIKRIVFASSCSVYGVSEGSLVNEASPLNPLSLYAKTRIMSEQVLLGNAKGIEVVVLRLATLFGLSQRIRLDLVVNALTSKAFFEKQFMIFNKELVRPLLHVRDAARAFKMAAEAPSSAVKNQVFNVGANDQNYTIEEIGRGVHAAFPEAAIEYRATEDVRSYEVDFDKFTAAIGFRPEYDIFAGIEELKRFFSQNKDFNHFDDRYYNVHFLYKHNNPEDFVSVGTKDSLALTTFIDGKAYDF